MCSAVLPSNSLRCFTYQLSPDFTFITVSLQSAQTHWDLCVCACVCVYSPLLSVLFSSGPSLHPFPLLPLFSYLWMNECTIKSWALVASLLFSLWVCVTLSKESLTDCACVCVCVRFESDCSSSVSHWSSTELTAVLLLFGNMVSCAQTEKLRSESIQMSQVCMNVCFLTVFTFHYLTCSLKSLIIP